MTLSSQHTDAPPPTLVGCLTPPGRSALATIAIVGPEARRVTNALFHPQKGLFDPSADPGPYYGQFGHDPSDDVVVAETISDSGIRTMEIHCHGGTAMVAALLEQIQRQGARLASWQELLRWKGLSETQIEATVAIANCRTERCAAILMDQAQGALDRALEQIESAGNIALARELLSWARWAFTW